MYRARQLAAFQRLCDGFDHHDLDAWESVYTNDTHYEDKALHWDLHGRDEA
ncbi:hypothetical protein J7I98_33805 [Streptomyces sp. ISL-98]|uniref:hypothetical protein n=1 Tax=Streptomyces sp. ISL-98 TaxID=2819192 RepID=UPI001BE6B8B9|nr:hypothetical protein [Streptomyces sp. ISL-98]MBT2510719.1 hypothetical protein [Streptomyces sp. ISL-98]